MEKLTWAEFFAAYMYVNVVLQGCAYTGNMTEASALEGYQRYLNSGVFSILISQCKLYDIALSRLRIRR